MTSSYCEPGVRQQFASAGRELAVWLVTPIPPAIGLTFIISVVLGGLGLLTVTGREVAIVFAASYILTASRRLDYLADKEVPGE